MKGHSQIISSPMITLYNNRKMSSRLLGMCLFWLNLSIISHERALNISQIEAHLYKYGYLNSTGNVDQNEMESAVKKFQMSAGMTPTGNMDDRVLQQMAMPRCGMPNNIEQSQTGKISKWTDRHITYKIRNLTRSVPEAPFKRLFEDAIQAWTENINLDITESFSESGNIDIYFTNQDGVGQTLGYAVFPEQGDIYFDQIENWSFTELTRPLWTNIGWAIVHELGHSLGLDHVNDSVDVMYPYYTHMEPILTAADKDKLIELYGEAPALDNSILCDNRPVEALLRTTSGRQILIKDGQYWTVSENGLGKGPFLLDEDFPQLSGKIDAAFSVNKVMFLIMNNQYYRFNSKSKKANRKTIPAQWHIPENIDATFFNFREEIIYVFKGSKYYIVKPRESGNNMEMLQHGRNISENWVGIPDDVEAATMFDNGHILFIKGDEFYIYDQTVQKVINEDRRNVRNDFYKC